MSLDIIILCIIICCMFIALIREWFLPEFTVFLTLSVLIITGILSITEALNGFSNPGVHTVALLFIISAALSKSGILDELIQKILIPNKSLPHILFRLMFPITSLSAILNNTPIVTMLIPTLQKWAFSNNINPSKLMIPLSYAAILGGTITLIGTSTNLIVHGLLLEKGFVGFHLFDFAIFGLPLTLAGIIYFAFIGHYLLPNRPHIRGKSVEKQQHCNHTFTVTKESVLNGQSTQVGALPPVNKFKKQPRYVKFVTLGVLMGLILASIFQLLSTIEIALITACIFILTKILTVPEAIKAIHWNVIILMGSSIGIGKAIEQTGLAQTIASILLEVQYSLGIIGVVILFYITTIILTEILNNLATAAFMFPIGYSISTQLNLDPMMFAMLTAIASSCSFLTPIGYQTNMLVYGPGGYKFSDYIKVGGPLSLICLILSIIIAYAKWL